ncbi:MAG: hypothetical protein QNJ40_06930 [Xanthomonadales bacterium]|nr:hypothetical protein [Xanthomonadales bacterium]
MDSENQAPELKMDPQSLYREEVFTDQKIGSLRRLQPVLEDGSDDGSRPVLYIGSAQLLTPAGPLPLSFQIEADSLSEATAKFGAAAEQALADTMEELKEMRRQASSSIVVPKGDPTTGGFGGMPGGGTIQMP